MFRLLPFDAPSPEQYVALLNDPFIHRHMPLATLVDEQWCAGWIKSKKGQWDPSGEKGPWSVWLQGEFVGWAGIQPDHEYESGLALVIHKRHWGAGREILKLVLERTLAQETASKTVIEFPYSRNAGRVLVDRGFQEVGGVDINGIKFRRYLASIRELASKI